MDVTLASPGQDPDALDCAAMAEGPVIGGDVLVANVGGMSVDQEIQLSTVRRCLWERRTLAEIVLCTRLRQLSHQVNQVNSSSSSLCLRNFFASATLVS